MQLRKFHASLMRMDEVNAQRNYYSQTAVRYDEMHGTDNTAHILALNILAGYIKFYNISQHPGCWRRHRPGHLLVEAAFS
jgi:hypothetical protein